MSSKQGLTLPNEVFPTEKELKILFTLKIRVSITLKVISSTEKIETPNDTPIEGETLEYQFIETSENTVSCVFCKSILGDFLSISGVKFSFEEFIDTMGINNGTDLFKNGISFRKIRISFFPFNWYACFEKEKVDGDLRRDSRWEEVQNTLLSLNTIVATDIDKTKLNNLFKIL